MKDPLIPLKLQFFEGIASELNSFLITFQSDKLMIPILVETLEELLKLLCAKFIRKDTLDAAHTTYALLKIDVTDTSNHRSVSDVDLGFTVKHDIKILQWSKKVTEIQIYNFKKEAMQFLVTLCNHIMEKKLPLILYLPDDYLVFHQIIWQMYLKSVKSYLLKY